MSAAEFRQWDEPVEVLGRQFVLQISGPVPPGRFEVLIWEGARRRGRSDQYLRAPVRGRDAEEARDRALEVLHNYVGLDQFRLLVEEAVAGLAPGAIVHVSETAREIVVRLGGPSVLDPPLAVPRDDVLGPRSSPAALRTVVQAHLGSFIRRREGSGPG